MQGGRQEEEGEEEEAVASALVTRLTGSPTRTVAGPVGRALHPEQPAALAREPAQELGSLAAVTGRGSG